MEREMIVMKFIGGNLRLFRKLSGYSTRALAERAEVTPSMISNYENGKVNPQMDTLVKLANVLEVDVLDFYIINPANLKDQSSMVPRVLSYTPEMKEFLLRSCRLTAKAKGLTIEETHILLTLLDKLL